jgi:hypothetical protein
MQRPISAPKGRRSVAEWTLYIDELKLLIDHYTALGLPLDAALQAADADLDQFISRRPSAQPFVTPPEPAPSGVEAEHRNNRWWETKPPKFGNKNMTWLCSLVVIVLGVTLLIGPHLRHIHGHAKQITWPASSD